MRQTVLTATGTDMAIGTRSASGDTSPWLGGVPEEDMDRWDADIARLDATEGDTDLEDCDTEPGCDEDGVTVVFGQYPLATNEDDEPDGPAEVWETNDGD